MRLFVKRVTQRLSSLIELTRPLALAFVGIVLLSLGAAFILLWMYRNVPVPGFFYYLTLQFWPLFVRGLLIGTAGLIVLGVGIWELSGLMVIRLNQQKQSGNHVVLEYRTRRPPHIAVLSGGAGMFILGNLSEHVERMTCIAPLQDPIEYYYRASGPFHAQNVHYVVPTPGLPRVYAELSDGSVLNVMHIDPNPALARRHVTELFLVAAADSTGEAPPAAPDGAQSGGLLQVPHKLAGNLPVTQPVLDAIRKADAIILGPGSLFESILPNLLLDDLREAIQQSSARKIYICNLMTEPGLTTGFSVGEHIRQIKRYGGFTPDYVLVNVQRIETEMQRIYETANQAPVYLSPEEYEETAIPHQTGVAHSQLLLEGSVIVEADLASSMVQFKAAINNPDERRALRVLRHDPEKLTMALVQLLRQK